MYELFMTVTVLMIVAGVIEFFSAKRRRWGENR